MNLTPLIEDLRHPDGAVRLAAVARLHKAVSEMEDIRSAQPALTLLLDDPDSRVKKAALLAVEYRGRLGADIGLAVPMLETLLSDDDDEIRETAWEAIKHADRRLLGIVEIVESRKPEFVFSRTTRTTVLPKGGPEDNGAVKNRLKEPYATTEARQFFEKLFFGIDVEQCVSDILLLDQNINSVRAAAYLLEVLGYVESWPGNPDTLLELIERAVFRLRSMTEAKPSDGNGLVPHGSSYGEFWVSVEKQINNLSNRIPPK